MSVKREMQLSRSTQIVLVNVHVCVRACVPSSVSQKAHISALAYVSAKCNVPHNIQAKEYTNPSRRWLF